MSSSGTPAPETLSGRWIGTISGTNAGQAIIDLVERGGVIEGDGRIHDFRSGPTTYRVSGRTDGELVSIELHPLDQPGGDFVVGPVSVVGRLDGDTISGNWQSEVGTQGGFHVILEHAVEKSGKNRVFLVHGHDEAARESVARLLERLGLEPIILSEQPSGGRTIIEKFEHYGDVDFAVVLLTPDDVGHPEGAPEKTRPRARQNVLVELGYFVGRLSRRRVCALHRGDVEIPSDLHGVVYVPLDEAGAWKLRLSSELRQAGINVDLNRVV